ncbi:hypothetical protein JCM8547_001265 [Rhodosporidiobolus lusitaniae]
MEAEMDPKNPPAAFSVHYNRPLDTYASLERNRPLTMDEQVAITHSLIHTATFLSSLPPNSRLRLIALPEPAFFTTATVKAAYKTVLNLLEEKDIELAPNGEPCDSDCQTVLGWWMWGKMRQFEAERAGRAGKGGGGAQGGKG